MTVLRRSRSTEVESAIVGMHDRRTRKNKGDTSTTYLVLRIYAIIVIHGTRWQNTGVVTAFKVHTCDDLMACV